MNYLFHGCELNTERVLLRRNGEVQRVEPQVFSVLLQLIKNHRRVVSRQELLELVWGHEHVSESTLSSCIKMVRKVVGDDGRKQLVIRTVHGVGYEFVAAITSSQADDPGWPLFQPEGIAKTFGDRPSAAVQPLIGRDGIFQQIQFDLRSNRLVTLVGPGGVGKTSLAYAVARSIEQHYSDGLVAIEMLRVKDPDSTVQALATALGVHNHEDKSLSSAVIESLRQRRLLLLLDNCEHLIETLAEIVSQIIWAAPNVVLLATSREAFGLHGEKVRSVEPLPFQTLKLDDFEQCDIEMLATVPAIQLFINRARAVDPQFELNLSTAKMVTEICTRLDGIPLAIELAAARVRTIGIAQIASRLDQRFKLLRGNRRDVEAHHQALLDTVLWSYELLSGDEQRLFSKLSVFAGRFDLNAVENICGNALEADVVDLVSRLVERSMVTVRQSGHTLLHYELLDTMRVFGREILESADNNDLTSQHAAYYSTLGTTIERGIQGPNEQRIIKQYTPGFSDIRATHRHNIANNKVAQGLALVCSMREYAMRTMRYEALSWADRAMNMESAEQHDLYPTVMAIRAYAAWIRGDFGYSLETANRVIEQEASRHLTPSGLAERVLGNVLYLQGKTTSGFEKTERQLELATESGNLMRMTHACYMHSVAVSSMGDFDLARQLANRACEFAARSQSPTDIASGLAATGFHLHDDPTQALDVFSRAAEIADNAGNKWMSTFTQTEVCRLMLEQGNLDEARKKLAYVVDVWFRAGEWGQQWLTLTGCVVALHQLGLAELAVISIGAIEKRAVLGALPVTASLRKQALDASEALRNHFGDERYTELSLKGADLPVIEVVQGNRAALLGLRQE